MSMHHEDENFMFFISRLEPLLAALGPNNNEVQKAQVNGLLALERAFRKALIRHPKGGYVYEQFLARCTNILAARPYFRERDSTFKAKISSALKNRDALALTRFDINYNFIRFALALDCWEGFRQTRKLLRLAGEIKKLRCTLVEMNLPFAISQARTFFGRNLQSHLAYVDFIQIAAVGLAEAIDKFCGPYTTTFRAVCIGRMLGNMIDENSQTFVHFFPTERKGLYRLRKLLRRMPADLPIDYELVHRELNAIEERVGDTLTEKGDMLQILAASQLVLASTMPRHDVFDDEAGVVERYPDPTPLPDEQLEQAERHQLVAAAVRRLPLREQKLLTLRGVAFD